MFYIFHLLCTITTAVPAFESGASARSLLRFYHFLFHFITKTVFFPTYTSGIVKMDAGRTSAFEMLFERNVPHILELIFFSLDYRSFQTCVKVNSCWNKLLSSKSYQKITTEMLIEKEKNEKKLWQASQTGNLSEVKRLVSSRGWIDVNCVLSKSQSISSTPLYEAADGDHKDVVQVLLDAGADPDQADNHGLTPLSRCVQYGSKEVVQLLLERGADPKNATRLGRTPLHYASEKKHTNVCKALLDGGAQPNKEDNDGWTPLHQAAVYGRKEVVQLLLQRGAHPNKATISGCTPLHQATCYGRQEVVKLLLNGGAEPNMETSSGSTPLHLAARYGGQEVVKLLLNGGADHNKTDRWGRTPLHCATQRVHKEVEELLRQYNNPGHN